MNAPVEITSILNADPGESIVYHRGYIAYDRGEPTKKLPRTPEQVAVNETAKVAWSLYERGRVLLTQRRLGANDYEYIATLRRS